MPTVEQADVAAEVTTPPAREDGLTYKPPGKPSAKRGLTMSAVRPHVGYVIAWQMLLTVAVYAVRQDWIGWTARAAGVALLLFVGLRWRGRWAYQWLPAIVRFSRSRRVTPIPDDETDVGLGVASALLPGLRTGSLAAPPAPPIGVLLDGHASVTVLAVDHMDMLPRASETLPLGQLAETLSPDAGPTSVQLLVNTVPSAPPGDDDKASKTARPASPLTRRILIVLRFGEPSRDGRAVSGDDLAKVVRRGTLRIAELLTSGGFPCRVLDEDGVRHAVASSIGEPTGDRSATVTEGWKEIRHVRVHTSYRVRGALTGVGLLHMMTALAAARFEHVAFSFTLTRQSEGPALGVLVRVVTPLSDTPSIPPAQVKVGGLRLVRMDGEQLTGLLMTLPLGVGHSLIRSLADPDLAALDIAVPAPGLLAGAAANRMPTRLRLFGPRPTHMALFGSVYIAQLYALRAAVAGVPVQVITGRPGRWKPVAEAVAVAGGRHLDVCDPAAVAAGWLPSGGPALIVDDTAGGAQGLRSRVGPGQAVITVRSQVAAEHTALVKSYDLVAFQRLTERTDPAFRALLPANAARWVGETPADVLACYAGGKVVFVAVNLTPAELSCVGNPRLSD